MDTDLSGSGAEPGTLEERLVPQVGAPIDEYPSLLSKDEEQAYRNVLESLEPAHAAAAARLHALFAG